MNFLGFALSLALLVAVQLTTFTWAAMNVTKTSGKVKRVPFMSNLFSTRILYSLD